MFKWVIFTINILVGILLIIVFYSANISPLTFAYTAFLGFAFPVLFTFLVIFLIGWLFTESKWMVVASLVPMLVTWPSVKATFQISAQSKSIDEIKLMTWNVKNFDLYNWSGNKQSREHMFQIIFDENPDIVCLQEFYTEDKGDLANLKDLKKQGGYKYDYFAKTYSLDGKRFWGLAILSKLKIEDIGKLVFKEGTALNSCIYADVQLSETQTIRIYNLHLQSNQFSDKDYEYLENLAENKPTKDEQGAGRIIQKLKNAYVKRAKQCFQVVESMETSPNPIILCGDFNDTPVSYAYKTLINNLTDAFVEKGMGFGKTYVNPSPFLRIDYVLMEHAFTINGYSTIPQNYSDHNPVVVRFKI